MNQTTEKSVLDISVYTNYIVNNCIREHIELKNEVKTKGVIFDKNRYAILTSHRFLVFANREAYLNKKKPRKEFNLTEHDFVVDSDTIQILKEGNVLKEYIFPTIEIAVHWWESILQLKRAPRVEEEGTSFNGFNQDISRIGKSNQQQDSRGNISTVFTKSVMYDIDGPSDNNNNNKGGGFGELVKEETERRKQLRQPIKKTVVSKVPEDKKSETSAKFPTEGNENNKQVPKDNTNNNDDDDDNEEEEGELNRSRIGKGKNDDDDDNNENDLNSKEPYKDIIGKDHNSNNDNNNNKPNNININFNNDKQSNKSKEPIKHVTNNYIILKSAYSPTKKEKGNDKNSNNNDNNSKRSNNEDNPETQNDNNNNNNNSKSNNDSIPNNEPFVISSVISNNEPNKQMTKPKDNSSPFINNTQPLIQPKSLHYVNTLHPHYEPQRSQNNNIHFHNDNTEPKTNHPQNDFNDKPTNNNNNAQDNNQPFMNNIDDNFFPLKSIHSTQSKFSTNSLNKTSSIFKKVITPSNSSSIPTQNVISNNNNNNHNNSSIRFSALLETEGNLNTLSIIPKQKDLSPNGSLSNEIVPTQENLTIKEVPAFKTKIDLLEKEEPSIRLISNNNNNNNTNDNKPDHKKLILEQYFNTPNNNIFPSTITPIKVIKKGKNKLYPITHCFYIEHDDDDDNDDDDDINNTKPKEETKQNANKNSRKKKKRKNRKNKSISYSNNNNNNDDYHLNNNSNVFYKDINIENDITPTKRTQEQPKTLRTKPMNETPLTLKRNSSTIGTQTDIKYNNDDIQNSINNESNDYDKIDNDNNNNNNNNTHYKSRNTNKGNNIEPISIDNIYHNEPNNFKGMNNTVDNIIYNNNNDNKERSSNCNNNSLLDYNNKKYSRNTYEPIYNNPNNKTLFNIEPKNPFNNAFECNETKDNNNNNTFISRYKLYGRNTHNNSNNQQHNIPNNITTDSITTPYSYRTPNNTNTTHYKQNIPLRTTNPPTFHNRSSSVTSNTSYYPPYSLNNNNPSMYHNYNHNHHINKSYYFIEKSFIKQTSQSPDTSLLETSIILPNNNNNNNPSTTTKIKPSTLIENLLQNRYSKPMLKLSLKDNSLHSSLISKVYDSISYVMSIQNSNYLVLNALYIKLPKLIRKRLNQEDLMLLSKNKGTIGFGPKTLVNEVALLIGRDIDELVNMFRKFHKIVFNSHNNTKYSTNNNNNKVSEMEMKKENFENEMSKLKNEIILINS